ncbi:MAG: hypothetical protein N2Z69_06310, partial [Methylophilaceae bacterium]|nr:hypothetical protein [Methylophilaceae bacterium]
TGRLIGRALSASLRAYALLATDSANRINQLPDHQFAQLDAHNSREANGTTCWKSLPHNNGEAHHGHHNDIMRKHR